MTPDGGQTEYDWVLRDLPAFEADDDEAATDVLPVLYLSEFLSWAEVSDFSLNSGETA